jgi:hypothetical protein
MCDDAAIHDVKPAESFLLYTGASVVGLFDNAISTTESLHELGLETTNY